MNLMGKILTLLIFFLSISFLVIAVMVGAAHRNWKDQAASNKKIADNSQLVIDSARSKSTDIEKRLAAEQVARANQLSNLQSQLVIVTQQRNAQATQLRDEFVISQERLDRMKSSELRLVEQDKKIKVLRSTNKTLVDDVATQRKVVVNLTTQLFASKGAEADMKKMTGDLSAQVAKIRKIMIAIGVDENELVKHIPPAVEGLVARVKDNFIAISLGTDDGIRIGHEIDIYRDGRFIGKATITKAEYNMSAARINPDFLQAPVEEGDNVTTQF